MPPAHATVPCGSDAMPAGQILRAEAVSRKVGRGTGSYLSWTRLGVLGYWLLPSGPTASEALSVRTTLPSMSQVRVSGCQSIYASV